MSRRWSWAGALLASALTVGLAGHAEAQGQERARALFEAGRVAVSEGDYAGALRHFTEAYELSQRPRLLFNMANAAERLRRDADALALYRQYLERVPDAENAQYVNTRIDALLTAQEEGSEPEPAPEEEEGEQAIGEAEGSADTTESGGGEPPIAGIALITSGAVAAVAGVVLVAVAAAERGNVDGAPVGSSWADFEGSHSTANTLAPIGGVLIGAGIALAVGGVIAIAVGGDEDEPVAIVPTGNGLLLRGSF